MAKSDEKEKELSDYGTPELRRHYEHSMALAGQFSKRVQIESQRPCDRYLKRGYIDQQQHEASNRIYELWYRSHPMHGLTAELNPDRIDGGSQGGHAEGTIDAMRRYMNALDKLSNELSRKLVVDVCCYGQEVKDVVTYPYRNTSETMSRFKEALDELVRIFGLDNKRAR